MTSERILELAFAYTNRGAFTGLVTKFQLGTETPLNRLFRLQ